MSFAAYGHPWDCFTLEFERCAPAGQNGQSFSDGCNVVIDASGNPNGSVYCTGVNRPSYAFQLMGDEWGWASADEFPYTTNNVVPCLTATDLIVYQSTPDCSGTGVDYGPVSLNSIPSTIYDWPIFSPDCGLGG